MALPNPTALLVAYLLGPPSLVDGVKVASRVPNPRPAELIQVRRVGGLGTPPVRDTARMDIFAWADGEPRAEELMGLARAAIWATAGTDLLGVTCYRIQEVLGPRLDDDDVAGTPRSWTTVDLTLRADEIMHYAP